MISLRPTTLPNPHSSLVTTSSLTTQTSKGRPCLDILAQMKQETQSRSNLLMKLQSIGAPKELSPQSRTRDHVDHAGPSPPLAHSRAQTSSKPENSFHSLSSSLSIVRQHKNIRIKDAMEVSNSGPSITCSTGKSKLKINTLTLAETRHASTMLQIFRASMLPRTKKLRQTMLSR